MPFKTPSLAVPPPAPLSVKTLPRTWRRSIDLVFVNEQVNAAPARTALAEMLSTLPDSVPTGLMLPVVALLASMQLAPVSAKPDTGVSVRVTAVPSVLTAIAVGVAGAGTFTAVVVIAPGVLAKLVCAKLKAPPTPPTVVFCTATRVVQRAGDGDVERIGAGLHEPATGGVAQVRDMEVQPARVQGALGIDQGRGIGARGRD